MNMFKKNGGFTLVELIVVIAILAILAGVAIPAYSGYITKAKDATVITELDAIQTAAQAANAKYGDVTAIEIGSDGKTLSFTGVAAENEDEFVKDFKIFYGELKDVNGKLTLTKAVELTGTSYENGAVWSAGKWTAVPKSTTP